MRCRLLMYVSIAFNFDFRSPMASTDYVVGVVGIVIRINTITDSYTVEVEVYDAGINAIELWFAVVVPVFQVILEFVASGVG